jgi:hypothetical protein
MLNYTLTNNNFNQISPIEPIILDFYAYFLIIIFLLCVCCNSFLLISQSRYKELYSPSLNYLIIAITASNLFGSIQFPVLIYSNFIRKWAFSKFLCHLAGWLMYFVGCMQVFLMAAICYERNFSITNPSKRIKRKKIIQIIILCLVLSLFWTLCPLLGWSTYSLEDSLTGCCVEYKSRNINVISYNISMYIFVFTIPFGYILALIIKLIITIFKVLLNF